MYNIFRFVPLSFPFHISFVLVQYALMYEHRREKKKPNWSETMKGKANSTKTEAKQTYFQFHSYSNKGRNLL